jgi:hypothetical protein
MTITSILRNIPGSRECASLPVLSAALFVLSRPGIVGGITPSCPSDGEIGKSNDFREAFHDVREMHQHDVVVAARLIVVVLVVEELPVTV